MIAGAKNENAHKRYKAYFHTFLLRFLTVIRIENLD